MPVIPAQAGIQRVTIIERKIERITVLLTNRACKALLQ
jgi:hypothetical protein